MDIRQLLLYRDLPESFMQTYGSFIRKRKRLCNGWQAVTISNGYTFFLHGKYEDFSMPAVKKICEVKDGKFIIHLQNKSKIVCKADGTPLTPSNKLNKLYDNGWYRCVADDKISLYDAEGNCVGTNLRAAEVFANGMYHMSVHLSGDGKFAGVFSATGKKLLFTNSKKVHVLPNGWFVDAHTLYNNLGEIFIEPLPMRKVPTWMLCVVGRMMKSEHL